MRATASDLIAALKRHHEPPASKPIGGMLLTEIQAPNSTRRADALWVPVSTAERGTLVGYETKVTRADVVQELRDPMKADAWERYCSRWWLVIPHPSLIDGLDIPDRWGVMVPPTAANRRTMTVVRQAPALQPVDARAAWGTIAARLIYGGETFDARLERALSDARFHEERHRSIEDEVRKLRIAAGPDAGSGRFSHRPTVVEVLAEIERITGGDYRQPIVRAGYHVSAEDIAQAVLAAAVGRRWSQDVLSSLESAENAARRAVQDLGGVRTLLAGEGS